MPLQPAQVVNPEYPKPQGKPLERNGYSIARIDFVLNPWTNKWRMRMYTEEFLSTYEQRCVVDQVKEDLNIENIKKWLVDRGWTVRVWKNLVRSWIGQPIPVRSPRKIKEMREEAKNLWYTQRILPPWALDGWEYQDIENANLALVP
ncbi:MAG: hypothetical protein JXB35_10545 [Anaerolineae bacterium]|nr:hypothetical protein [Anaerolineae bacterium]